MNSTAQDLRAAADQAKYLYATGEISYAEMVNAATAYINFCNERAIAIAKEYGMKPKLMSVKAFLR